MHLVDLCTATIGETFLIFSVFFSIWQASVNCTRTIYVLLLPRNEVMMTSYLATEETSSVATIAKTNAASTAKFDSPDMDPLFHGRLRLQPTRWAKVFSVAFAVFSFSYSRISGVVWLDVDLGVLALVVVVALRTFTYAQANIMHKRAPSRHTDRTQKLHTKTHKHSHCHNRRLLVCRSQLHVVFL